jgi:hypothetical protein
MVNKERKTAGLYYTVYKDEHPITKKRKKLLILAMKEWKMIFQI